MLASAYSFTAKDLFECEGGMALVQVLHRMPRLQVLDLSYALATAHAAFVSAHADNLAVLVRVCVLSRARLCRARLCLIVQVE
jgi:hypothetical protein